ncbi:sulfite exporter TauE/SafE family protein [Lapidilactobacillus bayanensis]|uniref:sulfite exporter TauE/SafE family protein n=1 Tax=Lapidilactobacillus bayanensis TaxID=2485998 RepID=UPI000F770628|nr:sulfite exporter TauE/SafE family protein [Lapidilactobacillus bayanensis]
MLGFILIIVGVLAGICNAVAGLASLVAYPALLALGLPPIAANVTDTVALIFSGIGATVSSQKELRGAHHELWTFLPITLLGCIVGALLLFAIPAKTFERVVPFFILFAAIAELIPFNRQPSKTAKPGAKVWALIGVFFVGVYSGYFGAAAGVLMLALLGVISSEPFVKYNAEKNMIFAVANVLSAIIYGTHIQLMWRWIIPLALGFLIGGYIGPIIVRHTSTHLLKILIGIGAIILAITLFVQAY